MKLHSGPISAFGVKAELAAIEKDLPIEVELVPFSIADGYTPKCPEILRSNPKGQIPVLLDDDLQRFHGTKSRRRNERLLQPLPAPGVWCIRSESIEGLSGSASEIAEAPVGNVEHRAHTDANAGGRLALGVYQEALAREQDDCGRHWSA